MSKTTGRRLAASAIAAVLLLSACGDDSGDTLEGTVVEDGLGCTITSVDRATEVPELPTVDPDAEPVTEVVTEDLEEPEEGACDGAVMRFLTVDMVGVKASDGTTFFNSFGAERPVNLRIGQGQLIAGLETSLGDMKVGGRRQITVPADQAYGADGNAAQGIGPDETLIFVVDVFAATDNPETCNEPHPVPAGVREGKPTTVEVPAEPWTELTTTDLVEGTGDPVGRDIYVRMEYLGVGCFSGAQFDSSWDRDESLPVALGDAEPSEEFIPVIPGWTEGIEGMKVGGLRQINIPAELAYGRDGSEPGIAPDEPLVFVVQLLEVVEPPEPATEGSDPSTPAEGAPAEGDAPGETTAPAETTAPDGTTTTVAG